MFMRHLLLDTLRVGRRVPIFLELRQVSAGGGDLKANLLENIRRNKLSQQMPFLDAALREGHFAVFLDGFDELTPDRRAPLSEQIQEFAREFDRNAFLLSSRADSSLEGWPDFRLLQLQPLTLDLACDLISRLPFDAEMKTEFISALRTGLFEERRSFLSNPLLISIMLLTYGQSAQLPSKLSVFYNQAYEALFERHDVLKGGYRRDRKSNLDIQDFSRLFAAFSLRTYDARRFEFEESQALEDIDGARDMVGLGCKSKDFLEDAMQAVCLLVQDGLRITFSHRSFQEYFAARFIADASAEVQEKLILKYMYFVRIDSVMQLLYELRPEVVEAKYLRPQIALVMSRCGAETSVGVLEFARFMRAAFSTVSLEAGDQSLWYRARPEGQELVDVLLFARKSCGHLVDWSSKRSGSRVEPRQVVAKFLQGRDDRQIQLANLAETDELFSELAKSSLAFSLDSLKKLHELGRLLDKRSSKAASSLDEILGTSSPGSRLRASEAGGEGANQPRPRTR